MMNWDPMAAIDSLGNSIQEGFESVVDDAEDVACNAWKAVIPMPLKNALYATQQQPWRNITRAVSFTAPSLLPLAVMPFTMPLALFFYPMVIWFETMRITMAVIANCFRASTVLKNEARDLLELLDAFSPNTAAGRIARRALNAAGAGIIVEVYDVINGPARGVLVPLSQGRPVEISQVLQLAEVAIVLSGDAELISTVTAGKAAMNQVEADITKVLVEDGALSSTAGVSSPEVKTLLLKTDPNVAAQLQVAAGESSSAGALVGASAVVGIAAGLWSMARK